MELGGGGEALGGMSVTGFSDGAEGNNASTRSKSGTEFLFGVDFLGDAMGEEDDGAIAAAFALLGLGIGITGVEIGGETDLFVEGVVVLAIGVGILAVLKIGDDFSGLRVGSADGVTGSALVGAGVSAGADFNSFSARTVGVSSLNSGGRNDRRTRIGGALL